MSDILLKDGDLPLDPQLSSGPEIIAQRVQLALGLFQSEWRLDGSEGLPWLRWFQETPTPLAEMDAVIRAEIADVNGVSGVSELDVSQEGSVIFVSGEATIERSSNAVRVQAEIDHGPTEFHPLITTNIIKLHGSRR